MTDLSAAEIRSYLGNRDWRLTSGKLYKLINKDGKKMPFFMNAAQAKFHKSKHPRRIVLKARQLGFSTYIDISLLDKAQFTADVRLGVIAHTLDDANDLFENKIRVAYDNQPEWLKESLPFRTDRAGEIRFAHGSSLSVGNSFRGGTLQHLHVSEFGKICAAYPQKAREIITGAFNTVAEGQCIDVESTAEGAEGPFFDMCALALDQKRSGKQLMPTDFEFHFFPWYEEPGYQIVQGDPIRKDILEYFAKLQQDDYVRKFYPHFRFTEPMMRWWQSKQNILHEDIMREYPSTPKEAFDMAIKGAYYETELANARETGRIGIYPYDPRLPVNTVWDIGGAGGGDDTSVWWYQLSGENVRVIDFWEGSGYSIIEVAGSIVKMKDYKYNTHFFPHDSKAHEQTTGIQRIDAARRILGSCVALDVAPISDGINAVRDIFPNVLINEPFCHEGIKHLASYRRKWDSTNGCFRQIPEHDKHSHAADAFRYLAQSVKMERSAPEVSNKGFEVDYSQFL